MYVYLNGSLVPEAGAMISVFDHGFLYGDGVYETMRAYGGKVFKLDEHVIRLGRSASLIGMPLPLEASAIKGAVYETLEANSLREAYVRVTVSRGPGPPGLDPALCVQPTFVIIARPIEGYPEEHYENGVELTVARTRRNIPEALDPRIKSLNFLNNIQAKREALEAGSFDALMLNHKGHLAECTVSNLFFVRDGGLFTPSVECGILDGITRGQVMGLAARAGMEVREGEFTKDDIYEAEEVFITNTTLEVMPVSRVDERKYEVGNAARVLLKLYRESIP